MCGPCEGGCADLHQAWADEAEYNANVSAMAQAEAEAEADTLEALKERYNTLPYSERQQLREELVRRGVRFDRRTGDAV